MCIKIQPDDSPAVKEMRHVERNEGRITGGIERKQIHRKASTVKTLRKKISMLEEEIPKSETGLGEDSGQENTITLIKVGVIIYIARYKVWNERSGNCWLEVDLSD